MGWLRVSVAGLVACGLLVASAVAAGAAEPVKLSIPALSGKHQVGTRSFEVVDRSRAADSGRSGRRRLMVQVTYPRVRSGSCRDAPYMPKSTQAVLQSFISLDGEVTGRTGVCDGGPVAGRQLPLLVFSHAYTASRGVYTSLIADLASRGFIVAAIDHTPDAFAVQFPTGPVVMGKFGSPLASKEISESGLASLVETRTADVRFVTTTLLRQNRAPGNWLKGRIDPERIGVFGHSLGGTTALRAASVDKRFRASADLDGSLFGSWPKSTKNRTPLLLFIAPDGLGSVLAKDKACTFFANAAQPKLAWELAGAKHLTFSDFQTLAPQIAAARPDWPFAKLYTAITGSLNPEASITSQRVALARFFTAYLADGNGKPKAPKPPAGVQAVGGDRLKCAT